MLHDTGLWYSWYTHHDTEQLQVMMFVVSFTNIYMIREHVVCFNFVQIIQKLEILQTQTFFFNLLFFDHEPFR